MNRVIYKHRGVGIFAYVPQTFRHDSCASCYVFGIESCLVLRAYKIFVFIESSHDFLEKVRDTNGSLNGYCP